jgi:ABC-type polysaccharide/polyol phosphate export permease
MYLAWNDTRARYKKSILGPLWLTLGNLVGVLGLGVVWATLLKEDFRSFIPSLTIGLIIWQLVAGSITDASTTFIRQASIIRNVAMPIWFFVVRSLTRQIINLLHNLLIIVGVIWYFDFPVTATTFLALPGLLLVIFNLLWITYALGFLGARFRDIEYSINAIMPLLFFISPVIFRADRLPAGLEIIWANPLSYFIEIVRAPFLGQIPSFITYLVMIVLLVTGIRVSFWINCHYRHRLPFWI